MLDILAMFDASDTLFRHAVKPRRLLAVMAGREYGLLSTTSSGWKAMLLHDLGMVRGSLRKSTRNRGS